MSVTFPVRSSAFSAIQVIASSLALFLLYKVVAEEVGLAKLGAWTTLMALSGLVNLADAGVTEALLRRVPHALVAGTHLGLLLRTSLSFVVAAVLVFAAVLYWPIEWLMARSGIAGGIEDIALLQWLALAIGCLMGIGALLMAALEGLNRYDARATVSLTGTAVLLLGAVILMPRYQLLGFVLATLLQNLVLVLGAWLAVSRVARTPVWKPLHWDWRLLRDSFHVGPRMKLLGLSTALFDPGVKFLVALLAGTFAAGLYEVSSRIALQTRSVVIALLQVVVPRTAATALSNPNDDARIYSEAVRIAFLAATFGFTAMLLALPAISELWFGHTDESFLFFCTIISCGWFCNALGGPAYFGFMGHGTLRWNIAGQLLLSVGSVVLSWLGFQAAGTHGLILGVAAGIAASSLLPVFGRRRERRAGGKALHGRELRFGVWSGALLLLTYAYVLMAESARAASLAGASVLLVYLLVAMRFFWSHPFRAQLVGR